MKKPAMKKALKKIISEERTQASKDHKARVEDWEDQYMDRLTDRIIKEIINPKEKESASDK